MLKRVNVLKHVLPIVPSHRLYAYQPREKTRIGTRAPVTRRLDFEYTQSERPVKFVKDDVDNEKPVIQKKSVRSEKFATVVHAIRNAARASNIDEIVRLFEEDVISNRLHIPIEDYALVLDIMSQEDVPRINYMMQLYLQIKKYERLQPNDRIFDALLHAIGRAPHVQGSDPAHFVERADNLINKEIPRFNVPLRVEYVNNLLKACLNHIKHVTSLFEKQITTKTTLEDTTHIYTLARKHYDALGLTEERKSIRDAYTYAIMIQICSGYQKISKDSTTSYLEIYDHARAHGINLDIFVYNALLSAILHHWTEGDFDRAKIMLGVYHELIQDGMCRPTTHTFTLLLQGLNKVRESDVSTTSWKEERMLALYREMLHQCTVSSLDSALLNYMAQSLARTNHLDEALDILLRKMKLVSSTSQESPIRLLTVQLILRKLVSRRCHSLEDFHANVEPVLALMRDESLPMTKENLTELVQRMVDGVKPKSVIEALCKYCEDHFKDAKIGTITKWKRARLLSIRANKQ